MLKIAIVADHQPDHAPHVATDLALQHAAHDANLPYSRQWLATEQLAAQGPRLLEPFDGLLIGPGTYHSPQGTVAAIRFARESGRPLLGTCGGFQQVVIEYARNVLGLVEAQHAEYNPDASCLLITPLPCSLAGKTLLIDIAPDSLAGRGYGRPQVEEEYRCSFGLNPHYRSQLENAGLLTTGVEAGEAQSRGEPRILELPSHPFFVATLFVPQMRSTLAAPHPLIKAFLQAGANHLKSAQTDPVSH